jgi:hypothetical protein
MEDGIEIGSTRSKVRQKLDSINNELKSLSDLILNIEKLIKVEGIACGAFNLVDYKFSLLIHTFRT